MTEPDYTNQPVVVIRWTDIPEHDNEHANQMFISAMAQIQTELSASGYVAGYAYTNGKHSVLIVRNNYPYYFVSGIDAKEFNWYGSWEGT